MIAELAYQELEPGSLARLFGAGCAAVLVRCPDVVAGLWRGLLEDRAEQMPWEAPLVDMARNYHGSGDITASLGDLFYFQRSEEHTSELQSLMRNSYAVFCLIKKKKEAQNN